MKILITGGAGFIGSHLSERLLEEQNEIFIIDNFDPFYAKSRKLNNLEISLQNPNCRFLEGDLAQKSTYHDIPKDIDIVIHLAAKAGVRPSIENPESYISSNFVATQNLLEWMHKNSIKKLVFASSSSVYGNNTLIPFSENHSVDHPISPYAFTKKACELMNYTYHHLYQLDIINLRFFTVFGERQRPDLAIHKFIKMIKNGETIDLYGDGETARDYTYVKDTVEGIVKSINYLMANENVYEIINLGRGVPIKLNELVDTIFDILKLPKKVRYLPIQAGDVDITFCDISKAQNILGYEAKTSLKEGIENFVANENFF